MNATEIATKLAQCQINNTGMGFGPQIVLVPVWLRDRAVKQLVTQGIETRRAETGTGSVHESPVGEADAPKGSSHD